MIVVRDVFDVFPDRVAEAEPLFRELQSVGVRLGLGPARLLVDRSAVHFDRTPEEGRFVIEREFGSLEDFSKKKEALMDDDRWHAAWVASKPVVHKAKREILEMLG